MADITNQLRIKFGLRNNPSQALQDQWTSLVENLIRQGVSAEAAGDRAAAQVFPDYRTMFYASEADTIESLLGRARNK